MISYKEGLNKVRLTKLQMQYLGMGLKESKLNTDLLVEGEAVKLESSDEKNLKEFVSEAKQIGVVFKDYFE